MRAGGGYKNRVLSGQVLKLLVCKYLGTIKLIDVERTFHKRHLDIVCMIRVKVL